MSKYAPPSLDLPPFAIVYGEHEIVLAYADTKEQADKAAAALNKQAPQYNHRVKELSKDGQQGSEALRRVRRGNA